MFTAAAYFERSFDVYYQPVVDLQTRRVTCFEALMRWRHPEKGFIPPSEFIPLAEEIGMIVTLGEWVLRQACAEAMKWSDQMNGASIFRRFNQVRRPAPNCAQCANCIRSACPAPELEVTESVLLERSKSSIATLNGCEISECPSQWTILARGILA